MSVDTGEHLKCAIWARCSTDDQHPEHQVTELRKWAAKRDLDVVAEFVTEDSAWASARNGNGGVNAKGAEFDRQRTELLNGARLGTYTVVLARSVDRLSRRGAKDMLTYVEVLTDTGCALWCRDDPWVEALSGPLAWFARDIMLSVKASLDKLSSEQKSRAIKDGIAERRRKIEAGLIEGHVGGRPKGAKDKRKRERKTGQAAGWTPERRAALAERNRQRTQEHAAG